MQRGIVAFNKIKTLGTKAVRFISDYPDLTLIPLHKVSATIVPNVLPTFDKLKATEVPFEIKRNKVVKLKLSFCILCILDRSRPQPHS